MLAERQAVHVQHGRVRGRRVPRRGQRRGRVRGDALVCVVVVSKVRQPPGGAAAGTAAVEVVVVVLAEHGKRFVLAERRQPVCYVHCERRDCVAAHRGGCRWCGRGAGRRCGGEVCCGWWNTLEEVLVLLVPVMVVAVVVAVVKPRNLGVCGRLPVSSACPELETAPVAFCSNDLSKLHPPNIARALPPCSYNRYAGREFWTTAPGLCPLRSPRFHFFANWR